MTVTAGRNLGVTVVLGGGAGGVGERLITCRNLNHEELPGHCVIDKQDGQIRECPNKNNRRGANTIHLSRAFCCICCYPSCVVRPRLTYSWMIDLAAIP